MTERKNTVFAVGRSGSVSGQVRQINRQEQKSTPFYDLLQQIEDRIELQCFEKRDRRQAEEIALIITEVMKLPGNATVRIAGNDLPAEMVALIFGRLTHDHVVEVMRRYRAATYEIKHVKTYLRTALYNSVFELEARTDNEIRQDMYSN